MSSTLKVDILQDSGGNNIISSDGSGDLTIPTGKLSGHMYPAFSASMSANQSISTLTRTKVEFDTENLDTNNDYDNSTNYRFTPSVAGKYLVTAQTSIDGANGAIRLITTYLRKNGSADEGRAQINFHGADAEGGTTNTSVIVDMNGTTDYLEVQAYVDIQSGSANILSGEKLSNFSAYRIGD